MLRRGIFAGLMLLVFGVGIAHSAWRVEIESKHVQPGQTGVTVDFTVAWDELFGGFTIPVVVRQLDPGAFWTGVLPRYTPTVSQGVTWAPMVVSWPVSFRILMPGPFPGMPCHTDADTNQYDAVSPDYFSVNCATFKPMPAMPDGMVFFTISFDVANTVGQFEFDTACFVQGQDRIYLIDYRGSSHTDDVEFVKGVITVSPLVCSCPHQGDVSGNGVINIVDLTYLINYALKGTGPPPVADPNCPALNRGDWDCNGRINIADIAGMAAYIFRSEPGPCNPCATK